jgi:hypothetical protein
LSGVVVEWTKKELQAPLRDDIAHALHMTYQLPCTQLYWTN